MASPDGDTGDFAASLFDGMVLFSPSDISQSPPSSPPPPPPPLPEVATAAAAAESLPTSQPLDEDLFSDLTLEIPSPSSTPSPSPSPSPAPAPAPARQISRKKKRAVRIGYGRDDPDPIPAPLTSDYQTTTSENTDPNSHQVTEEQIDYQSATSENTDANSHHVTEEQVVNDASISPVPPPPTMDDQASASNLLKDTGAATCEQVVEDAGVCPEVVEDAVASTEEILRIAKEGIRVKFERIRGKASAVSAERKEAGRRRRKAVEDLGLAAERYRKMERELEEACEAEDFEKAEMVSESLAAAEKEKDGLLSLVRDVEVECDVVDSEMEKVLEMQIAAEEEESAVLEEFAKNAAYRADLILKDSEENAMKELEEWQSSMESLESKRLEMDIESQLISDARAGLNDSIEHMVEDERREQEKLIRKKDILAKELDELLELVRLKQAEISENDFKIEQVEKRISDVFSEFNVTRSSVDLKHDNLQSSLSSIELEGEALITKKKGMDEVISLAQQKVSKLRELASHYLDESRTCQDMVELRKSLASSIFQLREDRARLGKTEEKILEDILVLRQLTSAARTSLQELSSSRASIQQEVASFKQRMDFIDKRGPELEAEKKAAAAARNFKEAGRIAAEAKSLSLERDSLQNKKEKALSDLEKLEEEIKGTLDQIQESEVLISSKEKEAAITGCRRLRLAAAASRAERSAALALGDTEEGEILLKEAEAAESKARELQEAYDLEWEELGKTSEHVVSISLVTNLAGQHLAEMASSSQQTSDSRSHE